MTELPPDIETDKEGYLLDSNLWNESLAETIAQIDNIVLTDEHWEVVNYVRKFYEEFNTSPAIRPLVKYLGKELGSDKGNSLYLYKLFPKGPAKQATKIAGLPKPKRCI
ncbi:TusE/DsrC/DsvC family sulfur relay protein [Pleionea sp. CnH1-48]|uniref:TusE/DsrC/DsvC family sulfur relay protein n=1 Tax=Pleionea sp. CnH1-48 TaxID=2954494 RepID=UPI002096E819|nr:TusE/DsrC/DsvC family sulfur relay protein [Pleionea sp. CnH1-48]MCO7222750.1 TusE/DsrC/DsvC family sulfur relay protein [Pleionea sp. CnH1-48]